VVRLATPILLSILAFTGCHKAAPSNDAVRQGVLDYLATKGMTAASMDINLKEVTFNGNAADATVTFAAKGNPTAQMTMQYHLDLKDGKWAVTGRKDTAQHGAGAALPGAAAPGGMGMTGGANPHGGGAMPAPEDLPPAGTKK
jgi:hypothetical protein